MQIFPKFQILPCTKWCTRLWLKSWPLFLHHSQHLRNDRIDGSKAWSCCRRVPVYRYVPSLLSLGFTPGNWQKQKNKTLLIYPFQWGQHFLAPCHLAVLVFWHVVSDSVFAMQCNGCVVWIFASSCRSLAGYWGRVPRMRTRVGRLSSDKSFQGKKPRHKLGSAWETVDNHRMGNRNVWITQTAYSLPGLIFVSYPSAVVLKMKIVWAFMFLNF